MICNELNLLLDLNDSVEKRQSKLDRFAASCEIHTSTSTYQATTITALLVLDQLGMKVI